MAHRAWLRCVCVVTFNIDKGQVLEFSCPEGELSDELATAVPFLALPDSNTAQIGDNVFSFRVRSDSLPLFAASPMDHHYVFGFCFFRQRRDPDAPRGFFQKSVVVLTDLPFVGLFKRLAHTLGPMFFDAGPAALEAAFNNINDWPAPRPGLTLDLPLMGQLIPFRVPWTGVQSYTPNLARRRRHSSARTASLRPRALLPDGAGAGASPMPPRPPIAAPRSTSEGFPLRAVGSMASPYSVASTPVSVVTAPSEDEDGDRQEDVVDSDNRTPPRASPASVEYHSAEDAGATSTDRRRAVSTSAPSTPGRPPVPPSPGSPMLSPGALSIGDVFDAKQVAELPGVFQEVGLFAVFRGLTHSLWRLWELAITGKPVLVLGTDPQLVGDVVMGIVSLISPLCYGGDYRPYFSLYDTDFKDIADRHDASKGASMPALLLGATNPLFARSLAYFPNALWIGPRARPPPSPAVAASSSPTKGMRSLSLSPRNPGKQASKVKPKVLGATVQLTDVFPGPGQESSTPSSFVTREQALVPPDVSVLNQLLQLRPEDELEPQLRFSDGRAVAGSSDGEVPAVVINNAVLRQHFRKLTQAFLKPFNLYFFAGQATASELRGLGPYDDLAAGLVPKFNEAAFLDHVKATGLPRLLRKAKWKKLYTGFIQSPHFWPWFRAREQATARRLHKLARTLRLSTTPEDVTRVPDAAGWEVVSPRGAPETPPLRRLTSDMVRAREAHCRTTRDKVVAALQREKPMLDKDPELARAMEAHLEALTRVLAEVP